jgi:hypothetical protein
MRSFQKASREHTQPPKIELQSRVDKIPPPQRAARILVPFAEW